MAVGALRADADLGSDFEHEVWFRHEICTCVFCSSVPEEVEEKLRQRLPVEGEVLGETARVALSNYVRDGKGRCSIALFTSLDVKALHAAQQEAAAEIERQDRGRAAEVAVAQHAVRKRAQLKRSEEDGGSRGEAGQEMPGSAAKKTPRKRITQDQPPVPRDQAMSRKRAGGELEAASGKRRRRLRYKQPCGQTLRSLQNPWNRPSSQQDEEGSADVEAMATFYTVRCLEASPDAITRCGHTFCSRCIERLRSSQRVVLRFAPVHSHNEAETC